MTIEDWSHEVSAKVRSGGARWFSEGVVAFGLILVVLVGARTRKGALAWLVGLCIVAACWFTAPTAFANPAVAIARSLTDTFAGIRPADVPGFILAEFAGAMAAFALTGWLRAPAKARA